MSLLKVLVFFRNDGAVRYGAVRYGAVRYGSVRYGDASGINLIEIPKI